MFGEFDQSPAYSAISGAVGEYLNDNMAGKDMGFSMSDRISKAMERAVGMGSTIDKYIDSALDDYNGTFGATHGNLLDCKIRYGPWPAGHATLQLTPADHTTCTACCLPLHGADCLAAKGQLCLLRMLLK